MKFQKVFSTIGAVALGMSLTAGAVFAEDEASMPLTLNVECSTLSDVEVYSGDGNGAFDSIDIAYNETSTSTETGDIKIKVDVGCDFGAWQVTAEISRFQDGSILKSFSGDKFSMTAEGVDTSFYDGWGILEPKAPSVDDAEFVPIPGFPIGDAGSEAPIFYTTGNILWFLPEDRKSVV